MGTENEAMKLVDVVERLRDLDEDAVLCVKRPWTRDAECRAIVLDEEMKVPQEARAAGYEYFLEVHVAREVLAVLGNRKAATDDKVRLLIFYAENDAYPDWVYS
jgi:hypothetical protein